MGRWKVGARVTIADAAHVPVSLPAVLRPRRDGRHGVVSGAPQRDQRLRLFLRCAMGHRRTVGRHNLEAAR